MSSSRPFSEEVTTPGASRGLEHLQPRDADAGGVVASSDSRRRAGGVPADRRGRRPSAPRAGRREWIGLAVIALPCVLYSMDLTVLNLAVPSLTAELKPSSSQMLWIVDIYGFLV